MASSLGGALLRQSAMKSAPSMATNRSLLQPQRFVQRGRAVGASNIAATAKAPTQAVKITIQGRRLPVRFFAFLTPAGITVTLLRHSHGRCHTRPETLHNLFWTLSCATSWRHSCVQGTCTAGDLLHTVQAVEHFAEAAWYRTRPQPLCVQPPCR